MAGLIVPFFGVGKNAHHFCFKYRICVQLLGKSHMYTKYEPCTSQKLGKVRVYGHTYWQTDLQQDTPSFDADL